MPRPAEKEKKGVFSREESLMPARRGNMDSNKTVANDGGNGGETPLFNYNTLRLRPSVSPPYV